MKRVFKYILCICLCLTLSIVFNNRVKAVHGSGGGSSSDSSGSVGSKVINNIKSYTGDCASLTSSTACEKNNTCIWTLGKCRAIVCPDIVFLDYCPNPGIDAQGNACKISYAGGMKQCLVNTSAKTCGEYAKTGNCPSVDDYGNRCSVGTYGACNTTTVAKFKILKTCDELSSDECKGTDFKGYICSWNNTTGKCYQLGKYQNNSETSSGTSSGSNNSSGVAGSTVTTDTSKESYNEELTDEQYIETLTEQCKSLGGNCDQNPYCTYKNGECTVKTSILKKYKVEEYQPGDKFFSGDATVKACGFELPERLPGFTSKLYDIIKIMVPVVIIVLGMFDFLKSMMANKEENAKKEKDKFIRRLIAGVIIFFIMVLVEFVFNHIDTSEKKGMISCMRCILSNNSCDGKITGGGMAGSKGSTGVTCSDYSYDDCPTDKCRKSIVTKADGSADYKCTAK